MSLAIFFSYLVWISTDWRFMIQTIQSMRLKSSERAFLCRCTWVFTIFFQFIICNNKSDVMQHSWKCSYKKIRSLLQKEVFRGKMHLKSQHWSEMYKTKKFTSSTRQIWYFPVLRLVIRCENFGLLHFEHGILACILQNSENISQIWKWHNFRQRTCIVKGFVSSIKYLTGEKSIPCWQRTITIFTFEKSFSVNGKYDINLLWKFKGKRKIIGQNLFLPKNHISTARLGKSLNHLMDMRLSRLIESSLNIISLKSNIT